MRDPFASASDSLIAPAREAFPISPDDGADINRATKAVYVGSSGDIVLRAIGSDADVTFRNVVAGSVLAIRLRAVRATGTTASDLIGLA